MLADDLVSSLSPTVITRSEAKALGLTHYYTGEPCHLGHIEKRQTSNGCCAECARQKARKWHHEHREQRLAYLTAWRTENAEAIKQRAAVSKEKYRPRKREKQRAWREANPDYAIAKSHEYHAANPGRRKVYELNRLARVKNVEGISTPDDINAIYNMQKGRCAICKKAVGKTFHIDHIVPVSKGGTNWPSNLQVTCQSCNCSKKGVDPIEHMQSLGYLL